MFQIKNITINFITNYKLKTWIKNKNCIKHQTVESKVKAAIARLLWNLIITWNYVQYM